MIWSICYSVSKSCAWVRHMQLPPETSLQNLTAKTCRANLAEDHRCLLQRLNTPIYYTLTSWSQGLPKEKLHEARLQRASKNCLFVLLFFVDPIPSLRFFQRKQESRLLLRATVEVGNSTRWPAKESLAPHQHSPQKRTRPRSQATRCGETQACSSASSSQAVS